jgi:hypothetical protein
VEGERLGDRDPEQGREQERAETSHQDGDAAETGDRRIVQPPLAGSVHHAEPGGDRAHERRHAEGECGGRDCQDEMIHGRSGRVV